MKTVVLQKGKEIFEANELWSEEEVQSRVRQLAAEIASRYKQDLKWQAGESIVVIPILDGAILFASDLLKCLASFFPPGTLELETFAVDSYRRGEVSGKVRITKETKEPVEGKHVLLVEDIIDTGQTLDILKKRFELENPKTLSICVLTDKRGHRKKEVKINHIGFQLANKEWLVGYGLDWHGKGRELSWIGKKKC